MIYDPADTRGLPFVKCGVEGCTWHWVNVRDLTNVATIWQQHVAETHTAAAETELLRQEVEELRVATERLREQLRRAEALL